jgi:cation:H+ antiporter
MDLLRLILGVVLLYLGGECLVRGAAALGRRLGLSPMVIGLTIVSVGTSSPELAATMAGVFQGAPAVSFGNVVGSNIANLALVLGLTAMIWPLAAAARFIRHEVPVMFAASALTVLLVVNGKIGRVEGAVLLVLLAGYLRRLLRSDGESADVREEFELAYGSGGSSRWWSIAAVVAGIALLVVGANTLIRGAVGIATALGVSERVIGLTMVAFGTSLPELASSLVAAKRGEPDIVLGNLIGSNVFNILFILGTTAVVRPIPVVPGEVWLDLAVMLGISLVVWVLLATNNRLTRREGLFLAVSYCLYIIYLFA